MPDQPDPNPDPQLEPCYTASVCAIRRKSDGYWWECNPEHGAGWNDKRIRQAWTMRAARKHVAEMRSKGMFRGDEVEIVELFPKHTDLAQAERERNESRSEVAACERMLEQAKHSARLWEERCESSERERDQWRDDYQREAARASDAERELSRKRDAASFYYKEIIRLKAKLKKILEVLDS